MCTLLSRPPTLVLLMRFSACAARWLVRVGAWRSPLVPSPALGPDALTPLSPVPLPPPPPLPFGLSRTGELSRTSGGAPAPRSSPLALARPPPPPPPATTGAPPPLPKRHPTAAPSPLPPLPLLLKRGVKPVVGTGTNPTALKPLPTGPLSGDPAAGPSIPSVAVGAAADIPAENDGSAPAPLGVVRMGGGGRKPNGSMEGCGWRGSLGPLGWEEVGEVSPACTCTGTPKRMREVSGMEKGRRGCCGGWFVGSSGLVLVLLPGREEGVELDPAERREGAAGAPDAFGADCGRRALGQSNAHVHHGHCSSSSSATGGAVERCATLGQVKWALETRLSLCEEHTGALPQRAMRFESSPEPKRSPRVDQKLYICPHDFRSRDTSFNVAPERTDLGGAGLGPGRQGHPRGVVGPGRRRMQGRSPAHPRLHVRHVGGGVSRATGALRRRLGAAEQEQMEGPGFSGYFGAARTPRKTCTGAQHTRGANLFSISTPFLQSAYMPLLAQST